MWKAHEERRDEGKNGRRKEGEKKERGHTL
jgi:hypothetical protein